MGALWLGAAILFGGVIGPVLLMFGLTMTPAASASLLLNMEGVLTALLAWFVFRENFDSRIALGMASIVAGAVVLSWQGEATVTNMLGPLAVVGACLAWAIDNNLTRKVSLSDPVQIAMLKGLVAGAINLVLAASHRGIDAEPCADGCCCSLGVHRLWLEPCVVRLGSAGDRHGSHRRLLLDGSLHRRGDRVHWCYASLSLQHC